MALIPLPPPPPRHPVKRLSQVLGVLVVLLLLTLAVGEPLAELNDQRHYPIPGRAVRIGDNTVHLFTAGQRGSVPTVLIDGDLGLPAVAWADLINALSKKTLVIAWDRPGYGWSPLGSQPHDGSNLMRQLHAALLTQDQIGPYVQTQELSGPYLLVGQGLGAAHMRIFAAEYPDQVAGMVLLDGDYPGLLPQEYADRRNQLSGEAWRRRLMIRRFNPDPETAWARTLPPDLRRGALAMRGKVDAARAEELELEALDVTLSQAQKLQSFTNKPLRVLTTDRPSDPTFASRLRQDQALSQLSTQGDHQVIPATSPFIAANDLGQPSPLLQAINQVLGTP